MTIPYLGALAVSDAYSIGVMVPDSKSHHGYGLVKHEEKLRYSKDINGMFLKYVKRKEKPGNDCITGNRELSLISCHDA